MKAKAPTSGVTTVIMEEYSETDPSEEGGEFGAYQPPAPTPRPRPPRKDSVEETAAKETGRKSFSLFGKKSLDVSYSYLRFGVLTLTDSVAPA